MASDASAWRKVSSDIAVPVAKGEGAGLQRLGREAEAVTARELPQHARRGVGDLHADAVARHHRDADAVAA
jgi:hypothetical protein